MAITTSLDLTIRSTWEQASEDPLNSQNTVTDAGSLTYTKAYNSGNISGTVNQIFNTISRLGSGSTRSFDMSGLTGSLLGVATTKSFSFVNSITIKNHSTVSGYDININVTGASGFKSPFGSPSQLIPLRPNSAIHINSAVQEFAVSTGNRVLELVDAGSGATFSISIGGHV